MPAASIVVSSRPVWATLSCPLPLTCRQARCSIAPNRTSRSSRSEEHTSELQSLRHLVCRLLLEKKNNSKYSSISHLGHLSRVIYAVNIGVYAFKHHEDTDGRLHLAERQYITLDGCHTTKSAHYK